MTDNKAITSGQTIEPENLTGTKASQINLPKGQKSKKKPSFGNFTQGNVVTDEAENDNSSQIKNKKNQTDNVKWSIFTEAETKVSVGKAAKKAGLKLNEWIDSRMRKAAIEELTAKSQPPAKTEDLVTDIVQQFADRMNANQEATAKAQNDLIEQQGRQLAELAEAVKNNQPKSILEMIFGKSKKD